jgi:hypothetical protein
VTIRLPLILRNKESELTYKPSNLLGNDFNSESLIGCGFSKKKVFPSGIGVPIFLQENREKIIKIIIMAFFIIWF